MTCHYARKRGFVSLITANNCFIQMQDIMEIHGCELHGVARLVQLERAICNLFRV
ncbi:MAG: hypothetical protein CLLPBCKN_000636 [Chroococcidiopsis cubana SAG 39.79]|nr:hypothetical protein [Chroococcidiopsis cubana SAG 39.79]